MKKAVTVVGLALAVLLAGCTNRSAVFVPVCGPEAPSQYSVVTGTDRIDATLNLMLERGWSNLTATHERRVANGECQAGEAPALVDGVKQLEQSDEADDMVAHVMLAVIAVVGPGFGTLVLTRSLALSFTASAVWAWVAYLFGLWPAWLPLGLMVVSAVAWALSFGGLRGDDTD